MESLTAGFATFASQTATAAYFSAASTARWTACASTARGKPMNGDTGHHGVTMGQDCLLENFDIQAKFIHDITMTNLMAGNVVKNGKGSNLSFDHHKRAPYENLFSNIDVGSGSQVWRCGGGAQLGKHSGARETFWGIRAEQELEWPPAKFGPNSMNIIGVTTSSPTNISQDRKWFEAIPPEQLAPRRSARRTTRETSQRAVALNPTA